jgi:hypothetical protein
MDRKNIKIIMIVIAVIIILCITIYLISMYMRSDPNSLSLNPLRSRGNLFGDGYNQTVDLEIDKDINIVTDICHTRCKNDPDCTGFGYSISDRYDERKNGNCWFMKGPIKFVDTPPKPKGTLEAGVWIKQ